MSRLSIKKPEDMSPEELEQYERYSKNFKPRPDMTLGGPMDPWIRFPELARSASNFSATIMQGTTVDRKLIEIAILVTIRYWENNLDWVLHSKMAPRAGIAEETVDAIYQKRRPENATEEELCVYDVSNVLLETRHLPMSIYKKTVEMFGERGLVEIIAAISFYAFAVMTINAFDIIPPEGDYDELPFPREPD